MQDKLRSRLGARVVEEKAEISLRIALHTRGSTADATQQIKAVRRNAVYLMFDLKTPHVNQCGHFIWR